MKAFFISVVSALIVTLPVFVPAFTPAFADEPVHAVSCSIENVVAPGGFVFKASAPSILLTKEDTELSYVDFSDPKRVWSTRRVYVTLALTETHGALELGVGIPEERKDFLPAGYVRGLTFQFSSQALRPFAGTVRCEPRELSYLFVHSRAAGPAEKTPPYTVGSFVPKADVRVLEDLLGQSCMLGGNTEAVAQLRVSPYFSKQKTLTTEDRGLSYRVDKWVGCRKYNDDDGYCEDPIMEKDGMKIVVPPCLAGA